MAGQTHMKFIVAFGVCQEILYDMVISQGNVKEPQRYSQVLYSLV
jgi:hypothetical protein